MAVTDILNRRVKALPEEEEEFSDLSGTDNSSKNASDSGSGSEDEGAEDVDGSGDESEEDVSFNMSFH